MFLADNVQVRINGLATASIYDIAPGDQLKLDVLNNKVTLITVTNRSIDNLYFAKIDIYNPTSKYLTVTDNTGNPHAYKINDTVSISYAGTKLPFRVSAVLSQQVNMLIYLCRKMRNAN